MTSASFDDESPICSRCGYFTHETTRNVPKVHIRIADAKSLMSPIRFREFPSLQPFSNPSRNLSHANAALFHLVATAQG